MIDRVLSTPQDDTLRLDRWSKCVFLQKPSNPVVGGFDPDKISNKLNFSTVTRNYVLNHQKTPCFWLGEHPKFIMVEESLSWRIIVFKYRHVIYHFVAFLILITLYKTLWSKKEYIRSYLTKACVTLHSYPKYTLLFYKIN